MDYTRQTALSVIFILVGMMFLVPATAEKALAVINASASGDCGPEGASHKCLLTLVGKELDDCSSTGNPCGKWTREPTQSGTNVNWATAGKEFISGSERGHVYYRVDDGKGGTVDFFFNNPNGGDNSCKTTHIGGPGHLTYDKCYAEQGNTATFAYGMRIEGIQP